ncbi:MAG: hypothetical protein HY695_21585 [Deltaproteobacteria bacterium]|nr:hypothetical protein [Deltaproteobacteria bacterium]
MLILNSMDSIKELIVGARFLSRIPSFLGNRWNLDEARSTLRQRLERRESDFLALMGKTVYANAASPYRRLLSVCGCEYRDLQRMVRQDGVEGTLQALYTEGVYLTMDEFKGRRSVVRGSATFELNPDEFHNPMATAHLMRHRSGSRGFSPPVPVDLASIRDRAVNLGLTLHARGGPDWHHAYWEVPGGSAMVHVLESLSCGAKPERWFSQVDANDRSLHPRYRWGARLMRWASLINGVFIPQPQYVPVDRPQPIARWLAQVLSAGHTPHLKTYASTAVRLCQAALEAGIDIRGAQFTVTGEPVTPARLAAIHETGASALPRCGTSEAGLIGYGCFSPAVSDDLHFFHDMNALIQPASHARPNTLPPKALLLTSLRPTARLILLNVSLGDQAETERRSCGCPLEKEGWTTHIHTIRSFEKLTAGGMTFLDADVIRVLDEILPSKFGGGPTDYQLLEEMFQGGRPSLRLVVHPGIGAIDETALIDTFLNALGVGSGVERVMSIQWREAGLLCVERAAPRITAAGKILHIHSERPASR